MRALMIVLVLFVMATPVARLALGHGMVTDRFVPTPGLVPPSIFVPPRV